MQPDGGFIVSAALAEPTRAAAGSTAPGDFGHFSNLLELVANPTAAKKRLAELAAGTAAAQTLIAEAKQQQAALVVAEKAHLQMLQNTTAEHEAALVEARQNFDAERLRHDNALAARDARLRDAEAQLAADQEALEELPADLEARAEHFEKPFRRCASAGVENPPSTASIGRSTKKEANDGSP